ncbi:acyl-CoA dehydrogenase [Desulforhopalus singaporensis]|uniref:Acyl-CoA dehydrogenase n=1 Tax=Desulforhopalus singaporensis TaxID=91360 RepID=A0A1H0L5L7_9BACT|nr:acyl-CoA dehydrogenase [Desulforhopalus singaporensis]SDO63326.1 acyl-CoA dehydrogenase [Desulforhopalus singaporensis]
MELLNPKKYERRHNDEKTRELALKTIDFFESKGLKQIKEDDQAMVWYQDFLDFIKKEQLFAHFLTPAKYSCVGGRWDMYRISEFNEILGFYGLCYWYCWQVSILGLGPIWMGQNEEVKTRTGELLAKGGVFAFGLSEQAHGADLYSSEMKLKPVDDGNYLAEGEKYYIGNGNCAALVSTFGKFADTGEYVFFVVDPEQQQYQCVKKIDTSGVRQAYVAQYALNDYPISKKDIVSTGKLAWDSSLNTINVGKFELGCASIGIATHCLYEAVNHAASRNLYGKYVTDFPHVQRIFTESYARLIAMKLFAFRAADYMRAASDEDRRYLLFNPVVKMKVTGQGETVVRLLHEIVAAKGFEQDTYFEMALRDIGMLPKLEGTEHVNMALIIKFVKNYFFGAVDYPEVGRMDGTDDDSYLFNQKTGGLSSICFPDYGLAYQSFDSENVNMFREQVELFRNLLVTAPPNEGQARDIDYMLAAGELFTLIVYGQLILENSAIYNTDADVIEQIFSFMVRDFSEYSLRMVLNYENSPAQQEIFRQMIKKPVRDEECFARVWRKVYDLRGQYTMND